MLPLDAGLAEAQHILVFHSMHPVNDSMTDLGLQFADKAVKGTHGHNRHQAQLFQPSVVAGDRVKRPVEDGETAVSPAIAFKDTEAAKLPANK